MTVKPQVTDTELRRLTDQADEALQAIQDALGREERQAGRVRFPRGFLVEASKWRTYLRFVKRSTVLNNVAYTWMLHDVYAWILRRTDLGGLARDMVVKAALASLGSIAEALVIDHFSGRMGRRHKFSSRTKRLEAEKVVDAKLREDLDWLWDMRCRQHLYELVDTEFDFYRLADHQRAKATVVALIGALASANTAAAI